MSKDYFDSYFNESQKVAATLQIHSPLLSDVGSALCSAIQKGHTVFWMGNGGSASDAQHLAAELVGRFERNRAPIASIALTTDSSILTSVGNDFGFDKIFVRQIQALGRPGDVSVGITTSGKSQNVISALEVAKSMGLTTVALVGSYIELVRPAADFVISVPSLQTCHIQESHITIGQALCGFIEATVYG